MGATDSSPPPSPPLVIRKSGLFLRGRVTSRSRKMMADGQKALITYTLDGGQTFQEWNPTSFHSLGDPVEIEVTVRCWSGRSGVSYNLIAPSSEETF